MTPILSSLAPLPGNPELGVDMLYNHKEIDRSLVARSSIRWLRESTAGERVVEHSRLIKAQHALHSRSGNNQTTCQKTTSSGLVE